MLRRYPTIVFTLLLALYTPLSASAETDRFAPVDRDWSLRIIGGSYKPMIDSQFDGSGNSESLPYQDYYGGSSPLMFTLGVERFISNLGGGISLGATAGIWSVEGALKSAGSSEMTSDQTELALYPLSVELSYYLDSFSAFFPIIPYGRIGADYCIWEIEDGAGDTANFVYQTTDGRLEYEAFGATKGWHYAVGVQLLLDTLDPITADAFERDAGVRNTYLGLEFRNAQIDDFGSSQSLRLGGKSLNFGLFIDI